MNGISSYLKSKSHLKKNAVYLFALLLVLGVALNYIKLFTADIRKSELSYEHDRMSEMADIYAENIKKSIKTYIDFTSLATAAISASGEINPSKVHQILQNIVDNTDFLSLSATFNDGSYIMAAEKGLNIPPPVSVQNTHETEMHFKILDGNKYLVISLH